jgi:RNA polymerase sigma-70 factor (ECF subfamily)
VTAAYFKQAYFSLHPKLYRVAYAILQNAEDAEDILQDAFCKLWDDREKLVEIKSPEAYSVTIIKNLCFDFLRSPKKTLYEQSIEEYDCPDYSPDAETEMVYRETAEKIKFIISRLPEKQQRILDLRAFAGCSLEEIEKITGESYENVRVLLSRARNTLKTKLKFL